MTDFKTWTQENLASFARDAQTHMLKSEERAKQQDETIAELREQLRVAIDGYRAVITKAG
jgi:hypothetical protein